MRDAFGGGSAVVLFEKLTKPIVSLKSTKLSFRTKKQNV